MRVGVVHGAVCQQVSGVERGGRVSDSCQGGGDEAGKRQSSPGAWGGSNNDGDRTLVQCLRSRVNGRGVRNPNSQRQVECRMRTEEYSWGHSQPEMPDQSGYGDLGMVLAT